MQPKILDQGSLSYYCADDIETDYGDILTPEKALAPHGPLHKQSAVDLRRWMSIPW